MEIFQTKCFIFHFNSCIFWFPQSFIHSLTPTCLHFESTSIPILSCHCPSTELSTSRSLEFIHPDGPDGAEKVVLCPHSSSHNWIEFQDIVALSDYYEWKENTCRTVFLQRRQNSLLVLGPCNDNKIRKWTSGSEEEKRELLGERMEGMQTRPKTDEIQLTGTLTHSGAFCCSRNNEGILYKI